MPDPVRSISFVIPGASGSPGVQVRVEEVAGRLAFPLDLLQTSTSTADLRGLFFRVADATKLVGLTVATSDGTVTELQALDNRVIDLGNGANMNGVVSKTDAFDVGVDFGSAGIGRGDDIKSARFTPSNTAGNLTLDDDAGFDIAVTAAAEETSNGDEEQATVTVPVVYDYGFNDLDTTFTAVNQSMWGSGEAFTFVDDRFLGIDESWNEGTSAWPRWSTPPSARSTRPSTSSPSTANISGSRCRCRRAVRSTSPGPTSIRRATTPTPTRRAGRAT
ncbi:MAG: hypothetical protein RMK81_13135, partial [Geminicoccaceae bacterium]|nr:hypothetical protein [Geminicoccaceae bacterium]